MDVGNLEKYDDHVSGMGTLMEGGAFTGWRAPEEGKVFKRK